ncbi:glycosyltransferase [Peribacillus sp. SCS-155]|uniref:glycosyltransferase n=1 Tax=Peribacillus sedimenti TaxID=3115297 RepID=UPI003906B3EB
MSVGPKKQQDRYFIFQDNSGKRWTKVWIFSLAGFIFLAVVFSVIGVSLFKNPELSPLELEETQKLQPVNESISNTVKKTAMLVLDKHKEQFKIPKSEIYGFHESDDPLSKESFLYNIDNLGVLIPDWYYLESEAVFKKKTEKKLERYAEKNNVKIMPRLQVKEGTDEVIIHRLLRSPEFQTSMIEKLLQQVKTDRYAGLNIDFVRIREEDKVHFTSFISDLYRSFHKQNLQVTLTVSPYEKGYDYAALSKVTDRMIVQVLDEHSEMTKPGPVASVGWTHRTLSKLSIPQEKLIISLGNMGYDWKVNSGEPAQPATISKIMETAAASNLKTQWDVASRNPYLRYKEGNDEHILWFLDAATSYNQLKIAMEQGIKGVAVQRLGYEDPGLWKFINDTSKMETNVTMLKSVDNPVPVHNEGNGEFIKIKSVAQKGVRSIDLDENGLISYENYEKYPLPFVVKKYGESEAKEVVLSFDDGPNPAVTPKILDILSEKQVPATFFVLGKQAALYPNIIERINREGHEIGSHTFSHANIKTDSARALQAEMNSTQRLIQQITGRSTTLFRPPYTIDAEYEETKDLTPILNVQKMGYTMVGSYIDTRDWETESSKTIVDRALQNLSNGNIILLHDSGGDRSATIEALPKIIDTLRAKGYTFVTTAHLVNKSKAEVMPKVEERSNAYMVFYSIADKLFIAATKLCLIFFTVGIILGIIRMLFMIFFSAKHRTKQRKKRMNPDFTPAVSVIIPAYNEEKVIEKTIQSILKSDYSNLEIIVVDDGSTDDTAKAVREAINKFEVNKVRLIVKQNGGKSSALNAGVHQSNGEIIIILDADTSIASNAISLLVNHFDNEKVAAVSGNVRIGNIRNLLTLWQHVEYVLGANLEKRSFHELNCITVVPGAIGAWKKSAIIGAGYFEDDTLAEDTDMTLKILREGHSIAFEPNAYAYTEAPEDLGSFIKQRFRWSYGILQCLWKHKRAMFNPKQKALGFIGLPNMLSQYFLQALSPVADIFFIVGLFGDTPKILTFYLVFLLVDVLAAFYAFRLEKVNAKPLLLLFVQRFIYRLLLTYTIVKSITFAIRGVLIGWNKLKRSGNVQLPSAKLEKGA